VEDTDCSATNAFLVLAGREGVELPVASRCLPVSTYSRLECSQGFGANGAVLGKEREGWTLTR